MPSSSNGDIIISCSVIDFDFLVVGFATALGYSIKTTEKFGIEQNISWLFIEETPETMTLGLGCGVPKRPWLRRPTYKRLGVE